MPRWKYKTSIIDPEKVIPADDIACDETGVCVIKGIPGAHGSLEEIMDKEGQSEWELVQTHNHDGKWLFIWKKDIKEAIASQCPSINSTDGAMGFQFIKDKFLERS